MYWLGPWEQWIFPLVWLHCYITNEQWGTVGKSSTLEKYIKWTWLLLFKATLLQSSKPCWSKYLWESNQSLCLWFVLFIVQIFVSVLYIPNHSEKVYGAFVFSSCFKFTLFHIVTELLTYATTWLLGQKYACVNHMLACTWGLPLVCLRITSYTTYARCNVQNEWQGFVWWQIENRCRCLSTESRGWPTAALLS